MQQAPVTGGGGQVVVVHTVFTPFHVPLIAAHCACVLITHASGDATGEFGPRQHAPRGMQVSLPQVVPAPFHTPLHAAWVVIVQPLVVVPSTAAQHAPVGSGLGQDVFVQTEPLPRYWPPVAVAHWAWVSTWQRRPAKPSMQHAPVTGWGQGLVVQVVLAPCHVPPWQLAWVVSVQDRAPVLVTRQQAPRGTQMSFAQVVFAPFHVPWQFAWVVMVNPPMVPPAAAAQQAPVAGGWGHGLVVQVVPAPCQMPLSAVQLGCARTEQFTAPVAVVMQHAPDTGGGQLVCVQAEPAPFHIPPVEAHCASATIAHHRVVALL